MNDHDRDLAKAFDGQAEQFARAPVQTDPAALRRLVDFAGFPKGARVLDAGCGPGLVSAVLLEAGYQVHGVDLSAEMVQRARTKCAAYASRARFEQCSVFEVKETNFDAAISRYVLHHVTESLAFIARQAQLVRPGGAVVASDHTTDPKPERAHWHQEIERDRDRTHTRNLTPGQLVDLFASAGLENVQLLEEPFTLDFDEWFDRGTPRASKAQVREQLNSGSARGFWPEAVAQEGIRIHCWRALVRGIKP